VALVEEFISALSKMVAKAVSSRERGYTLVVAEVSGVRVLFCLGRGVGGHYYAKVVLEEDLPEISCVEAEYSPRGLYAFATSPSGLAEKSHEKALVLVSRKGPLSG